MTKTLTILLFVCLFQKNAVAQSTTIDALASNIPQEYAVTTEALASYIKQNFTSDSTRIRAIYVWVADHIKYDVERLAAIEKGPQGPPQPVADVLKTRAAVCQGYADLFVALCTTIGINATTVGGYTKRGGKISPLSHAWVAVENGGVWHLYDPTWGAGYVKDDRFVKALNNRYYKLSPGDMIKDHMPFDPIFQFLDYPLNNLEFMDEKNVAPKTNLSFNYKDSLKNHLTLSPAQKAAAELRRLQAAGIRNTLLEKRQAYLLKTISSYASKDSFEEGGRLFKRTLEIHKEYMEHKRTQFSSLGDMDLRTMIDSMSYNIRLSRENLIEAIPKTDAQRQAKASNISSIERFGIILEKEKAFVERYLATEKASRLKLFTGR